MKPRNWTCLAILLLVGCVKGPAPGEQPAAKPETTAATATPADAAPAGDAKVELQILDFQGIQDLVASHVGKVVVMDAWSTSCTPCVREFPNLVALHNKHGAERLACISLSFDYEGIGKPEDVHETVLTFLKEKKATFENVLSSVESDELSKRFKLAAVPAVFVYDKSGTLRKRFDNEKGGEFTYREVSELVVELLEEPAPEQPMPQNGETPEK